MCSAGHGTDEDSPQILLGKSYFDLKEYRRAAFVLYDVPGPKAQFLRWYATYLAGEKRREEERIEKAGPMGNSHAGGLHQRRWRSTCHVQACPPTCH